MFAGGIGAAGAPAGVPPQQTPEVLRLARHLLLDLGDTAVGPSRAAAVFKDPLLDDLGAETLRSTAQRVCEQDVVFVRPCNQHPSAPLFPDEVLRQGIGEHGEAVEGFFLVNHPSAPPHRASPTRKPILQRCLRQPTRNDLWQAKKRAGKIKVKKFPTPEPV